MTHEQYYLAHDMTDEDLEYCENQARKLEQMLPWAEQDNTETDADCWLTIVMRVVAKEIEHHRAFFFTVRKWKGWYEESIQGKDSPNCNGYRDY